MAEATDLERKAENVVQTILSKGPELTLTIHARLQIEVNKIATPWQISITTTLGEYWFFRNIHNTANMVAQVEHLRGQWVYKTPGASPNASPNVHDVKDDPHKAMDAADHYLRLSGLTLMPGRPTASPWLNDQEMPGWVRIQQNGAPKSHLVRVFQSGAPGSNWFWKITKLAGPGPTKEHGPWATKEKAMAEADDALHQVGWVVS